MKRMDHIFPFSSMEIEAARKLTESIDTDLIKNIAEPGKYIENMSFGPDMAPHILAEQQFYQCSFEKMSFSGTNSSHILLKECQLEACEVINSNFKFSDFTGSGLSIVGCASSFDSSDFTDASINSSRLEGCSFSGGYFCTTELSKSKFIHSEFIGASFFKSCLNDLDLVQTNLDFAEFEQVQLFEVIFPYWSTLHVVKGLPEILSATAVSFSTPNGKHCVQGAQYREEITLLRPFLYQKGDYLALANSYLIEGEIRKAYDVIIRGVDCACYSGNLSTLGRLCRLASLNNFFSKRDMRKLYEAVENTLAVVKLSPMQYRNYLRELDSAKRLLIDCPFGQDEMDITIQTSIPCSDYQRMSSVLELIDTMVIKAVPQISNHIEVRHNSPIEITITLCGALGSLLLAFSLLDFIFDKSTTYVERVQNIILNHKKLHAKDDHDENLEKQVFEIKKEIQELKQQATDRQSLILPGSDEFQRISYKLSSKYTMPEELRTYSISRH